MNKRWVIADTHFGHSNIMKYESRPFCDVEMMDWQMVTRWNNAVAKSDTVFMNGDFALASKERIEWLLQSLNGNKFLIMGNHDDHRSPKWWRERGFCEVSKYPIIVDEFFIISHEPIYLNDHMPYYNIHGHIHSKIMDGGNYFNSGVELNNFTPVNLDKLIKRVKGGK